MDWSDLERPTPQWFKNAKLGIFVHWGVYSLPAWAEPTAELGTVEDPLEWFTHNPYAEWYYNTIRIPGSPAAEHHRKEWGGCDYDDLLDQWHMDSFDASELMELFKESGADYVVLTTKHHDGITLWDAVGTGDRNTVKRGPHQDLVGAYADAARKAGLRFGTYYSGGLDWHVRPFPPHTTHESVNEGDRPRDEEYAKYAAAHIDELVERYHPDVLWNDINYPDAAKNTTEPYGLGQLFARYYEACPEGVVNDRWKVPHCDYVTSEYQMNLDNEDLGIWENCRGLGLSFGYNQVEGPENGPHPRTLLHTIVDAAVRDGRILLGVGPKADGTIPEWQADSLRAIGRWMQVAHPILAGIDHRGSATASASDGAWAEVGSDGTTEFLFAAPEDPTGENAEFDVELAGASVATVVPVQGARVDQDGTRLHISCEADWAGPAIIELSK